MKKLIFLVGAMAVIACQQEKNNTVTISGTVTGPVSETASLISNDRSGTYTDTLDADAHFEITFDLEEAKYMSFKHGQETTAMYVLPGDVISISINPAEFDETISYEGSESSNFLAKKYLIEEKSVSRELYLLPTDSFLMKAVSTEKEMMDALDNIKAKSFVEDQQKSIWFQWAGQKLNYPYYYNYINGEEAQLTDNYYGFISEIDLNDPTLLEEGDAYNFLQNYLESQLKALEEKTMMASLNFIGTKFTNQEIIDKLSYNQLKSHFKNVGVEGADELLNTFQELNSDTLKHQELTTLRDDMLKFSPGMPAFDFTYPDVDGEMVSLSDFKGSFVYVDVWATWCGPCKREIPHLVELEKDYHNKNIVFLSVSVDEDKDRDTWLNMLEEKEMGGVQLFASGWSKITKDYMINGIPRFMLFDGEGNIIDVNASRPSQPETRILFSQLLK
jgi:thiol-disulfide isomerase/thioredoxin